MSAAIRLKQLDADLDVVVLEKGSEVGAHILSGAVLDPCGLDALIPDWKERGAPVTVPVRKDNFYMLGEAGKHPGAQLAHAAADEQPRQLYRLYGECLPLDGRTGRGLGRRDFSRHGVFRMVYGDDGQVKGVVAGEFGKNADGTPGDGYEPGMELHGKYVFLSEGVRGSLSKEVIARFSLSDGKEPQKYGLGMKEIWEIDPEKHREGTVTHTMGWPLGQQRGRWQLHLPH